MAVALCLMALKRQRPGSKYVLWSRVDQKSCFKAILTAGLEPVIMSLIKHGDELRTDTHTIEDVVNQHGGPGCQHRYTSQEDDKQDDHNGDAGRADHVLVLRLLSGDQPRDLLQSDGRLRICFTHHELVN